MNQKAVIAVLEGIDQIGQTAKTDLPEEILTTKTLAYGTGLFLGGFLLGVFLTKSRVKKGA